MLAGPSVCKLFMEAGQALGFISLAKFWNLRMSPELEGAITDSRVYSLSLVAPLARERGSGKFTSHIIDGKNW